MDVNGMIISYTDTFPDNNKITEAEQLKKQHIIAICALISNFSLALLKKKQIHEQNLSTETLQSVNHQKPSFRTSIIMHVGQNRNHKDFF